MTGVRPGVRTATLGGWRGGPRDTGVACPACGAATLVTRSSCVETRLACGACRGDFTVADLATRLTDDDFSHVAEAVGERPADRL